MAAGLNPPLTGRMASSLWGGGIAPTAMPLETYKTMQIAHGVYSIRQTGLRAYPSGHTQAYLLDDGKELTLIDTLADDDAHLIFEALESIKRPVTDIKHIVITHAHLSHLGGLAVLKRASRATVYAHEWEADIIAGDRKAQPVSLWPTPPIRTFPQRVGLALGLSAPACDIDRPLKDGDSVGPVQVMHTPGHTPGHLVFYWPKRQALFAGDNIMTWPRFGAGWPSFQVNKNEFCRSFLRLVKELDPRMQLIGVGHGEPIIERAAERVRCLLSSVVSDYSDASWEQKESGKTHRHPSGRSAAALRVGQGRRQHPCPASLRGRQSRRDRHL